MPTHEYYEELCALAASGQLSASELAEFNSHLKMCSGCRSTSSDFSLILGQLPSVDLKDYPDNIATLQSSSYRERFLTRAESEGIHFPADVREATTKRAPVVFRKRALAWATAGAIAATALVAVMWPPRLSGPMVEPTHSIARQPSTAPPRAVPAPSQSAIHSEELSKQLVDSQTQIIELKASLETASIASDAYRSDSVSSKELLAQTSQRVDQLQQSLARLQAELERTQGEKGQTVAALVEQQVQLNDLRDQLKARDAAAEQERQLSAAAKDVRELMGSRNLHIIDVADVDARGRSRKAFGRVFFVENTSLIFYAFDLSAATHNAKVLFQAWGQREGSGAKPRNLGVFRIDDHAQQRWVLRVEDPKLLAGIDSLFVTVEAGRGADQPSGRKLIYAYLGTEPNHP